MRFRENESAQHLFQDTLGKGPGMRIYTCYAGDWQFVITYDLLHSIWSASYQPRHPTGRVSSTPCDEAPPGEKFMKYDSQRQAEIACERKFRQLRKDN